MLRAGAGLVGLQGADGVLTTVGVRSGAVVEVNRLMAGMAGETWFTVLKIMVAVVIVYYLHKRSVGDRNSLRRANRVLIGACVVYCGIVAWNVYWLASLGVI